MARKESKASPKGAKATGSAVIAKRVIESTGSTLRIPIERLPDRHVRIVEYHRLRKGETRYSRHKDEEGHIVPFHQLKLAQTYEELFPQGDLFGDAG